jgi:hypothetical protein
MSETADTQKQTQADEQEQPERDEFGNVRDMSAHIPEGTEAVAAKDIDPDDRDMSAKTNDLGEGLHTTSPTFGHVVSDHATDAAGLTPQALAERLEGSSTDESSSDTSRTAKQDDDDKKQRSGESEKRYSKSSSK